MGGLLYNAFVSVRGKKMIRISGIVTILFILVKRIFPGWRVITRYVSYDENGVMTSDLDILLSLLPAVLIITALDVVNIWNSRCIESDEKNKIRTYLAALPLGKNAYVASKYVFIGITYFVLLSLSYVWYITAGAFSIDAYAIQMIDISMSLLMPVFSFALLISAEELFLFLVLGKKKAMMIKVGVCLLLGIAFVGWLLFGNLYIIEEGFYVDKLVDWMKTHTFEVVHIQILSPVISLLIYFGSYKLCCWFYNRKERDYD